MLQRASATGDADAMLAAGAAALRSGLYLDAVGPTRSTLRQHPGNARLWQLLGLLSRNLDDLAVSVEAFGKAAELAPNDAMIAFGRSCVTFEAGLPASELFAKSRRISPSDRSILLRLTAARIAEGRGEEALAGLERELLRDPRWLEAHAALARQRWTFGDRQDFARSFEQALAALPRDVAIWRAYVETFLNAQMLEQALIVIERARAAAGAHLSFDVAEAIALGEQQKFAQAEPLFRRLAHVQDVSFTAYRLRFLIRSGRIEEAAAVAEHSAPRDPSHKLWPYLSVIWRLLGDTRWEWLEGDPRFIGVYDLAEQLPDLRALTARLRALHKSVQHPFDQSLRGGTQTEGHLFPRIEPEIRQLRSVLLKAVQRHVAQLPPPRTGHPLLLQQRAPIRFAGSWSVRLTDGGRHIEHVHPAGWLSSAFYIAVPQRIEGESPEAG